MDKAIHDKLKEPFKEDEIQWRVITSGKKGEKVYAIVAPYVDSRAIMDRLDSVVGFDNWESHFTETVKGMICELTINGITKSDGADYTDIEPTKGGISDALKRAGNQWGMGRYLYTLPTPMFAIITDKGKHSGAYTDKKTKQKIYFKWDSPKLPTWALSQSSNTGNPRDFEGVKQEGTPKKQTFTELCGECYGKDKELYFKIIGSEGYEKASEVTDVAKQKIISDKLIEEFGG